MAILKFIAKWTKDLWMILGITALLFVGIEAAFSLMFYARSFWHPPVPNFREQADTYPDRAWASSYYKEIDEVEKGRTMKWKPYTYWRRSVYNGRHITIGPDGLRKTLNPAGANGAPKKRLFVFGGSTIWGLGSDDATTIPSLLAKEAGSRGLNYEVVNFGQYAYVSTQSVIELTLQLQKGNIPDAVIFYDGVNDTFGAFQSKTPGLAHGELERENIYNLGVSPRLGTVAAQAAIRDLAIVRFLRGIVPRPAAPAGNAPPPSLRFDPPIADQTALARAVVDTYLNNMKIVQGLARTYGFKLLAYWQPVIYTKERLTAYETRSLDLDFNYPGMKEFYLETYGQMRQRSDELKATGAIYDISAIFREAGDPIYVDFNHMGERGNSVIARRMMEDFARIHEAAASGAEPQPKTQSQGLGGR
ncbi:MAG: hypothetical protein SF339_14675 [Blastocatellia bacterium]|nr:hypothetical protein [Blastocatellia bacterium]